VAVGTESKRLSAVAAPLPCA